MILTAEAMDMRFPTSKAGIKTNLPMVKELKLVIYTTCNVSLYHNKTKLFSNFLCKFELLLSLNLRPSIPSIFFSFHAVSKRHHKLLLMKISVKWRLNTETFLFIWSCLTRKFCNSSSFLSKNYWKVKYTLWLSIRYAKSYSRR